MGRPAELSSGYAGSDLQDTGNLNEEGLCHRWWLIHAEFVLRPVFLNILFQLPLQNKGKSYNAFRVLEQGGGFLCFLWFWLVGYFATLLMTSFGRLISQRSAQFHYQFSIKVQDSSLQEELQESSCCSNWSKWRGTKQQASLAPSETEELTISLPLPKAFDCLWHHELHPDSCGSNGLCPIWKARLFPVYGAVDGAVHVKDAAHVKAPVMPWCSSCQRPAVSYQDWIQL